MAVLGVLPLAGPKWRTRQYVLAAALAIGVALPFTVSWPLLLWQRSPDTFTQWLAASVATRWSGGITRGALADFAYFPKMLSWYAWPALPLAAWTLWRARRTLAAREDLRLALVA